MPCLLVRPDAVRCQPWSAEIHLRFPVAREFYIRLCIATRTNSAARRVTTFKRKNRHWCPEDSEHRASSLRMAPGDVAHVPRPPSPVAEAGLVAKHFRPRARLRRLLVRLRRPTLHRSLRSLRQRGFALYVRLRHYRSSLFCCRKIIPSHSFAALAALVVRRESGYGERPMLAWVSRRALGRPNPEQADQLSRILRLTSLTRSHSGRHL